MKFNFIGQSINFGEGITTLKRNGKDAQKLGEKDLLFGRPPSRIPSPMSKKKKNIKKMLRDLPNKEIIDGSKK